jgi:hypothetical protein
MSCCSSETRGLCAEIVRLATQGGSMTAVVQAAFNLNINATIQTVSTTQAQLLQVCFLSCLEGTFGDVSRPCPDPP